jgi:hypothetical protein
MVDSPVSLPLITMGLRQTPCPGTFHGNGHRDMKKAVANLWSRLWPVGRALTLSVLALLLLGGDVRGLRLVAETSRESAPADPDDCAEEVLAKHTERTSGAHRRHGRHHGPRRVSVWTVSACLLAPSANALLRQGSREDSLLTPSARHPLVSPLRC